MAAAPTVLPPQAASALTLEEKNAVAVFRKSAPSVLGISHMPLKSGASLADRASNMGNGFIWDESHVVTSLRMVNAMGTPKPHVNFLSNDAAGADMHTSLPAIVVGADPVSDVAVLRVAMDGQAPGGIMRPLRRGASTDLRVGQEVFAIGSPFGLEHSMSRGVISGVRRIVEGATSVPMFGVIQTDASAKPGYIGGPLLDSTGAAVGVNTIVPSAKFGGVGLAVPIEAVARRVDSVIQQGFVNRAWLGAIFAPDTTTAQLGLAGAMVLKVAKGSPAEDAGLRPMRGGLVGDVIVGLEGKPMSSSGEVLSFLDQRSPGDEVLMQVKRPPANSESDNYEQLQLRVQLGASKSRLNLPPDLV